MSNSSPRDFYTVLGVESNATSQEIKVMYHKLAKKYHGDANSTDPQLAKWSHKMMVELNEAYGVLQNPDTRRQYDQQKNSHAGQTGTPPYDDVVYIENLEQGREILLDGMNHFELGAPTPELEKTTKEELKRLLTKRTKKYLKMGVPNKYPISYLEYAIESAAVDAVERIQERVVHRNVMWICMIISIILGIIFSIRLADGFVNIILITLGFVFGIGINYLLYTWIARLVVHGFKSNLVGLRGLAINGVIGILAIALSVNFILFPDEVQSEEWQTFVSQDDKFSVLLPLKPEEQVEEDMRLPNGKKAHMYIMSLETPNARYFVYWATHPDIPAQYRNLIQEFEERVNDGNGSFLAKQKSKNESKLCLFDLPDEASMVMKLLISGKTIYGIGVETRDNDIREDYVQKFIDSFKVIKS